MSLAGNARRVLLLCGPTAAGKSAVAMSLAKHLNIEIICADARTVFRGLDIGTAKPTPAHQALVRHHCIDICDPHETYDAARFAADTHNAIAAMSANVLPVIVGGSGLYIQAALDGLSNTTPVDPRVRAALQRRLAAEGRDALFEELRDVDAESAERYADRNPARVVRALEHFVSTGRPFSATWQLPRITVPYNTLRIGVSRDRAALYSAINERCERMWAEGIVDETQRLLDAGINPDAQCLHTVGYVEVIKHLRGEIDAETALAQMQQATRRYAKRQVTWFRKDERILWLDANDASITQHICTLLDAQSVSL